MVLVIKSKQELEKATLKDANLILLDTDEKEIRRIIEYLKTKNKSLSLAVFGRDDSFNRRMIETCKIHFLISPERETEKVKKKDSLKQRDSGLNHYLAKEAKKKGIAIIIDFSDIKSLSGKKQAIRLSRVMQNIIICRKAKCRLLIIDFSEKASKKELMDFGFSLGMSSQQAKDAVEKI